MSDLAGEIRLPAQDLCEYCRLPQAAFRRPFHIEHIIAKQHGGLSEASNLALACWSCNFKKGPNLSGIDPSTGLITPLFNPRTGKWEDHFLSVLGSLLAEGVAISGRTAAGRATVHVPGLNDEMRQMIRYELWKEGLYTANPPSEHLRPH
jgi:hypothetical protein